MLSIAAGIIILLKPSDSLATLAVIAGIFLLVDGIIELAASLMHGTRSRGSLALLGVLTAIVGVLLIRHPIGGVAAIALLIGLWLITVGVIRSDRRLRGGRESWLEHLRRSAGAARRHRDRLRPEHRFATLALLVGIGFILNGMGMFAVGGACAQGCGGSAMIDPFAGLPVAALSESRTLFELG